MTERSRPKRKMTQTFVAATIVVLALLVFTFFLSMNDERNASGIRDNEAAAVGAMRVISTGLVAQFAANTGAIVSPEHPHSPGYAYHIETKPSEKGVPQYFVAAVPIRPGKSGNRSFFTDESGVIRASEVGTTADATSPPIR